MPMLAEKKQKAKWVLNPRGSAWAKDENKFGQKLLEKMGWTPGTGLGAQKQGITDILRIPFKNNFKGIGCKETEEPWSKQQADFDQVLAELGRSDQDDTNVSTKSSLEEKSKRSKARVHYHKFIRGKDVSKYSLKDLNCITGIDTVKKTIQEEEEGSNENNMYSYFESKMNNSEQQNDDFQMEETSKEESEEQIESSEHFVEHNVVKNEECLVKKNHKSVRFPETNMVHYHYIENCLEVENKTLKKEGSSKASKKNKRKRKIKNISYVNAAFDEIISENSDEFDHSEDSLGKKKKKRSRTSAVNETEHNDETTTNQNVFSTKFRKKRKQISAKNGNSSDLLSFDIDEKDKRKLKKHKKCSSSTLVESYTQKDNENYDCSVRVHEAASETSSNGKKKGNKSSSLTSVEENDNSVENELLSGKLKKTKKRKSEDSEVIKDILEKSEENFKIEVCVPKRYRKCKDKKGGKTS